MEREGNMNEIAGLRFHIEEVETRCSRIMYEAELSRFYLRDKGEVGAELRRALEADSERRGGI